MAKHFILLASMAALLLFPAVSAQETTDNEACDVSNTVLVINDLTNEEPSLVLLNQIERLIQIAKITCNGYVFSSDVDGLMPVIGPITISAGIYRATVTTEGSLTVTPTALDDECGTDMNTPWFTINQGDATFGIQSVIELDADCEILLEISNVEQVQYWGISLEKIR